MKKIALFFLLCISISYPITQSQGYAVAMLFETSPYPSNISPVQVAILDTGINGFEDHVIWESDLTYSDDTGDNAGHGTAMAEAIIDTNGAVEIYNIKILDSMSGEVNLINALNVASAGPDGIFGSRDDPEVISLSLALNVTTEYGDAEREKFRELAAHKIVCVSAAGNEGTNEISMPAGDDNVIGVGAVDKNKNIWINSNRGPHVEVVAPGVGIILDSLGGGASGTSISTAFVSGLLSVYIGVHGRMTIGDQNDMGSTTLRGLLHSTAIDLGDEGYDESYGYGLVQFKSGILVIDVQQILLVLSVVGIFTTVLLITNKQQIQKQYQKRKKRGWFK